MALMQKVRPHHVALAVLTILAYLSGDFGLVHDWPGYGVAAIICFRLLWAPLACHRPSTTSKPFVRYRTS